MSETTSADLLATIAGQRAELARVNEEHVATTALGGALAGLPLVDPHAGQQLMVLLRNEVTVTNGVATGPGGVDLADHVKAKLSTQRWSHFLRSDADSSLAPATPPAAEPKTMDEAIRRDFLDTRAAQPGGDDRRLNPRLTFGITVPNSR
jgi:hypothetical protein